jgi:hypothetical protein
LADVDEHGLIQRLHDASAIPPGDTFSEGRLPDDGPITRLFEGAPETVLGVEMPAFHVPKAILGRRSTRAYSGATMDRRTLAGILAYGYDVAVPPKGLEDAGLPRVFDPCLIETYVVVHAVDGVEAGGVRVHSADGNVASHSRGRFPPDRPSISVLGKNWARGVGRRDPRVGPPARSKSTASVPIATCTSTRGTWDNV